LAICFTASASSPLTPRREFRARRESRAVDRTSERRAQFIGEERRRIGDDVENIRLKQRAILTLCDEVLDELVRERDRLADRHAEANEVYGVHGCGDVENGERSVRTYSECPAVFVLFVGLFVFERRQTPVTVSAAVSKVFISYRHVKPDESLAVFLKTHLETNGHAPFVDTEIDVGEKWVNAIERNLRSADVFLVLLSKDSILSDMVRKEIALAHEITKIPGRRLKIFPVRVNFEGKLPYDIGAYLDPIQYLPWTPDIPFLSIADRLLAAIATPAVVTDTVPDEIDYTGTEELRAATDGIGVPLPAADPRLVASLESGTLAVESPFYVRRESDSAAEACLQQLTPTVIVKAPRQLGKSSLLARMHAQAKALGRASWYLDFQLVDGAHMRDLDTLFRFLARQIARTFQTILKPKDFWDEDEGPMGNFTNYLEDAVLRNAEAPVQIVFDEAERVFDFPYRDAFFATIRGWHNQHATNPNFRNLTVVIGHATTPALWIQDLNQSPFNVGHPIQLHGFGIPEIAELGRRYNLALTSDDLRVLLELLGGHAYLTRVALHTLATRRWKLPALLAVAANESGPFADNLHGMSWMLNKAPELFDCLRQVIYGRGCGDERHFQRLWAAGLVRGDTRAEARMRCRVYEDYFRDHLP
jgi:AAA-like domain/TIR domain